GRLNDPRAGHEVAVHVATEEHLVPGNLERELALTSALLERHADDRIRLRVDHDRFDAWINDNRRWCRNRQLTLCRCTVSGVQSCDGRLELHLRRSVRVDGIKTQ